MSLMRFRANGPKPYTLYPYHVATLVGGGIFGDAHGNDCSVVGSIFGYFELMQEKPKGGRISGGWRNPKLQH